MGVERPYKNRIRLGVDETYGSYASGSATAETQTTFLRSTLIASWSPIGRLTLQARLPWVTSWIEGRAGARSTVNGLGDLQLTGRVLLYRERGFAPHHLLWATLGLKFPTAPRIRQGLRPEGKRRQV